MAINVIPVAQHYFGLQKMAWYQPLKVKKEKKKTIDPGEVYLCVSVDIS
jgi:hypothetical protein